MKKLLSFIVIICMAIGLPIKVHADDVKTYQAPIIKSMSLDNNPSIPIDSHQYLKANIDIEVKEKCTYIDLVYINETTQSAETLTMEYDKGLNQYVVYLEPQLQYKGEFFKFLFARVYSGGDDINIAAEFAYYTPYSKEQLNQYQDIVNQFTTQGGELDFHYSQSTIQNMDILLNYFIDDQVPCIEDNLVQWKNTNIIQPGLASLQFKVNDFNQSGVCQATVLYTLDGMTHAEVTDTDVTGIIKDHSMMSIDIPISRYADAKNTFKVYGILLRDYSNKYHIYYNGHEENVDEFYNWFNYLNNAAEVKESPIQIEQPTFTKYQTYDKMISSSSTSFINDIKSIEDGQTVVINYAGQSVIPKEVFEAIQGKNITLIFDVIGMYYDEGIQWVIHGKDITNPKTIDLAVEVTYKNDKVNNENKELVDLVYREFVTRETANKELLEKIKAQEGSEYYVQYLSQFDMKKDNFYEKLILEYMKYEKAQLVFKKNGELPSKMTIRYNPDYTFRGYLNDSALHCYFVDGDEYVLIQDDIQASKDNCYEFDITHNSTYVLMTEKIVEDIPQEDTPNDGVIDIEDTPDIDDKQEEPKQEENKNEKPQVTDTSDYSSIMTYSVMLLGAIMILKYMKTKKE